MIFKFLIYLQPTYAFTSYRNDGSSVFPLVSDLPTKVLEQLDLSKNYKSLIAKDYDISWQAIQKGYIGNARTYHSFEKLPVLDEYTFIRNYFNSFWSFYVLIIRLISFNNPFREIVAWRNTRKTKKSDYLNSPIKSDYLSNFHSILLDEKPLVSVVIPTLNRYDHLKDVLQDFEKQTYKNFEILIIDQSQPFRGDFCTAYNLNIKHIYQEEPALWLARNTAIKKSSGNIIALSEDDVRISPDWIENHLKALDFFKADISAGVFYPEGHTIPEERSFFCVASQFATGNAMLYKNVFKEIGLFDRQFEKQRMGDGEFGLRAYLNGFKSISNPYASCIDVKARTGGLREMGSWDAFRPKNLFAPRPIPSVLYFFRKYFGPYRSLLAILKTVPQSIIPYRYKKKKKMLALGVLISVLLFPFVILQVSISWRLATNKLKEGAMIEKF